MIDFDNLPDEFNNDVKEPDAYSSSDDDYDDELEDEEEELDDDQEDDDSEEEQKIEIPILSLEEIKEQVDKMVPTPEELIDKNGNPISQSEWRRRKILSIRQKGNKSAAKSAVDRATNLKKKQSIISAYATDISSNVKRERYLEYVDKVRNKEIGLDEVEALLHFCIAEQLKKSERFRDHKLLTECTTQIRQLTETKRRIEEAKLSITRDRGILNMFENLARILAANIADNTLLNKILLEFKRELTQTIDIKNIDKSVENEMGALDSTAVKITSNIKGITKYINNK